MIAPYRSLVNRMATGMATLLPSRATAPRGISGPANTYLGETFLSIALKVGQDTKRIKTFCQNGMMVKPTELPRAHPLPGIE
jgi:hypothetical protein